MKFYDFEAEDVLCQKRKMEFHKISDWPGRKCCREIWANGWYGTGRTENSRTAVRSFNIFLISQRTYVKKLPYIIS